MVPVVITAGRHVRQRRSSSAFSHKAPVRLLVARELRQVTGAKRKVDRAERTETERRTIRLCTWEPTRGAKRIGRWWSSPVDVTFGTRSVHCTSSSGVPTGNFAAVSLVRRWLHLYPVARASCGCNTRAPARAIAAQIDRRRVD